MLRLKLNFRVNYYFVNKFGEHLKLKSSSNLANNS